MITKELIVVRHTLKYQQQLGGYTLTKDAGTQWVNPLPKTQRVISIGYFGNWGKDTDPTICYEFTIEEGDFNQYPIGAKVSMALEAHE